MKQLPGRTRPKWLAVACQVLAAALFVAMTVSVLPVRLLFWIVVGGAMARPRSDGAGLWCASRSVMALVAPGVQAHKKALPPERSGDVRRN